MRSICIFLVIVMTAPVLWSADYPVDKGAFSTGGTFGISYLSGDLYGEDSDGYLASGAFDYTHFFIRTLPGVCNCSSGICQ